MSQSRSNWIPWTLQGVPQYCIHFCFLNFSASYSHRNSILGIFQQAIMCRFWKYPIFYYSVKFGPRYWQNTAGRSFQKLTFFVYYSMKQFSIHELSWVLMSSHKHSCALMSTLKYGAMTHWVMMSANDPMAPCSWLLLSSHECLLLHGPKLMSVHGRSWVLIGNQEHSWLLLAAYLCPWMPMSAHECPWLLMKSG